MLRSTVIVFEEMKVRAKLIRNRCAKNNRSRFKRTQKRRRGDD